MTRWQISFASGIIATGLLALLLSEFDKKNNNSFYVPEYKNKISENTIIGTYQGHRVEISRENGTRKINLYYTNFTPDTRAGFISAIDYDDNGIFDYIKEENLLAEDSLKEFANNSELEKAYASVSTNGFYLSERGKENDF